MTREKQTIEERAQFDLMIRLLGLNVVEIIKREGPDFLIKLPGDRTIGIEVVRAVNELLAEAGAVRARFKTELKHLLSAAGLDVRVNATLENYSATLLAKDRAASKAEATAVVELVRANIHRLTKPLTFERTLHEAESLSETNAFSNTNIRYLSALIIDRCALLSVAVHGLGRAQGFEIVQAAIDNKADKLPTYQNAIKHVTSPASHDNIEIWLLVVGSTDGGALLVDDVEDRVFTSPFDKTIFLELFEERCVYLATRPIIPFSDEFRADVVQLCASRPESISNISKRLKVPESAIRRWISHADALTSDHDKLIADQLTMKKIEKLEYALNSAFPLTTINQTMIAEQTANWDVYFPDDRADLRSFEGMTWLDLPAATLKRHPTMMVYAGDTLFCATLPAFLRYLLHERESFNDLPFQLAGQLTRRTDVDNKKLDRRMQLLTHEQQTVVFEAIAYLATVKPMDEIMSKAIASWNHDGG